MEKQEMYRTYYENGNLKEECPLIRGKLHGVSTVYREDGKILEKRIYQNDMCIGNPFTGMNVFELEDVLGLTDSTAEEWQEALEEEGEYYEITPEFASIILLDNKEEEEN